MGNMVGTPIVAAFEHYLRVHGAAAGHEVFARTSPRHRSLLSPHAPVLGLLGAKWYPYPFCAELLKNAAAAVRADEDAFLRELAVAGIDGSIGTVARILLRYAASPSSLAARGQEAWNMFHDEGRVSVDLTERRYVVSIHDWTHHEPLVCKISKEVRRRLLERAVGGPVEAHRDRCIGWGHEACVVRLEW